MDKKRKRSTKNPFSWYSRWWENSSAEIHSLDCWSPSSLINEQREREREDLVCFAWKKLIDLNLENGWNEEIDIIRPSHRGNSQRQIALGRYLNPDETGNIHCRRPVCPRYQRRSETHRLFDGNRREESQWESLFQINSTWSPPIDIWFSSEMFFSFSNWFSRWEIPRMIGWTSGVRWWWRGMSGICAYCSIRIEIEIFVSIGRSVQFIQHQQIIFRALTSSPRPRRRRIVHSSSIKANFHIVSPLQFSESSESHIYPLSPELFL